MTIAVIFIFGIVFGSFITAVSYRLPKGADIIKRSSFCPDCGTSLQPIDLIPIFSWLFGRGKCRHCDEKISARYPIIEFITADIFVLIYLQKGLTTDGYLIAALSIGLITASVTDLENRIIPNSIQLYMLFIGGIFVALLGDPYTHLLGAVIGLSLGLALYYGSIWILKKEALGFGDVKFFAVAGLWTGNIDFFPFIAYAGIFGVIFGVASRLITKNKEFPFVPALATGLFVCLLFPETVTYYWDIFSK